jgi:hypothetical protein
VAAQVQARGITVRSVLPVAVGAYWRFHVPRRHCTAVVLGEAKRISALLYENGRLTGIDVEPVLGAQEEAVLRLLRRARMALPHLDRVYHWTALAEPAVNGVERALPGMAAHDLALHHWET